MKIGVISDTHGLLRAEVLAMLSGADHIIHAGDIGSPELVPRLQAVAPTTAIRGNVDTGAWADLYPSETTIELGGWSICVVHDVQELDIDPAKTGTDLVVSGHSHRPRIETIDGVLYLNPGSVGPRRFKLPISMATLELSEDNMQARIHEIGP